MELIKHDDKIQFKNNENVLFELEFYADEFVWTIYTNEKIIITRDDNEELYNALEDIMSNEYIFFENEISLKDKNKIIWLSDQSCDLDNKSEVDRINRIIIEKENDTFLIYAEDPFCKNLGIKKNTYSIIFSPGGNGYYTQNINTNLTFQDDIVICLYNNIMNNKKHIKK